MVQTHCLPQSHVLYTNFLHQDTIPSVNVESYPFQLAVFPGVLADTEIQGRARLVTRHMLQSELEKLPARVWPGRPGYFFCQRGCFPGVLADHAPPKATRPGTGVIKGVFESVPHIYCDILLSFFSVFASIACPVCRITCGVTLNVAVVQIHILVYTVHVLYSVVSHLYLYANQCSSMVSGRHGQPVIYYNSW